jgi:hypothetical protein
MTSIPYLYESLKSLRPNSSWIVRGDDSYENIEWQDPDNKIPSPEELLSESHKVAAEKQKTAYRQQRSTEYPMINDQLDMLYHDMINGTHIWTDMISAIKTKYPKP